MNLPDAGTITEFAHILLLVLGTVLALFGVGIYHGALRLFGGLVGGTFGFLLFLSSKSSLPELGNFGPIIFGLLFAFIGAMIGSWLAEVAHYTVFFVLGCIVGYFAILVGTGAITPDQIKAGSGLLTAPAPLPWHWIVIVLVGLVYLAASNWMIAITCAIVGATMVASGLDNRLILYFGAPLGILVQYGLFMRHEHYHRPRPRVIRRTELVGEHGSRVIYDRGEDLE